MPIVRCSMPERFTAKLTGVYEGPTRRVMYNHPISAAPRCRLTKSEHQRGQVEETVCRPNLDEVPAVQTVIHSEETTAKREARYWATVRESKVGVWLCM